MKAPYCQREAVVVILTFVLCYFPTFQVAEDQLCNRCDGTAMRSSAVEQLCNASAGRINGRCCWRGDNTSDSERIIGLDLSNCSLTQVDDLSEASTALVIDLSLNQIDRMSNSLFLGFVDLNYMILPQTVDCPGGNSSWDVMEVKEGNRLCKGQRSMCNQTGEMSLICPDNALCDPYGPGFFQCNCVDEYHGYKCMREGEFPAVQVFGPLGASTVVLAAFLWVTQRRKAKSV